MTPLLYDSSMERQLPDEHRIIERLGATALATQRAGGGSNRRSDARDACAKATGRATGTLTVLPCLLSEFVQNLFAAPAWLDVLVRCSQGPPEPVPDAAAGQLGMPIKVLCVHGPGLAGSRETTTRNWVLAPDPTFVNRTAATLLRNLRAGASRLPALPDPTVGYERAQDFQQSHNGALPAELTSLADVQD